MKQKGVSLTVFLAVLAIVFFIGQAKADVSSDANAQQFQNTQQMQQMQGGSPNQSITFEGSSAPAQHPYPRTIMPYSPATQLSHAGYWIPVAKDGLFQEMGAILAQRKIWNIQDALAFVNCVERSPGEVKNLFDVRVVPLSPAGSPQRTMKYIDNYEANDLEEFNRCFRLVGTSATFGTRGRHLTKVKKPVDSNEVYGRTLTEAFGKLDGTFFIMAAEGAPMQMNADTLQQNAGFALGSVSGPGSGNLGAFIGYTRNWSDSAAWPLRVPYFRLNTYESTGKKYVPRSVREAVAKAAAAKKAAHQALLKKIAAGDEFEEEVEGIKSDVKGKEPAKKADPRIILRNSGQAR